MLTIRYTSKDKTPTSDFVYTSIKIFDTKMIHNFDKCKDCFITVGILTISVGFLTISARF